MTFNSFGFYFSFHQELTPGKKLRRCTLPFRLSSQSGLTFNHCGTQSFRWASNLWNISQYFQLMSCTRGNLGLKSILLAVLVGGMEQSDLEGMQAVLLEYKQVTLTSNQHALQQCFLRLPSIFFSKSKSLIQQKFLFWIVMGY